MNDRMELQKGKPVKRQEILFLLSWLSVHFSFHFPIQPLSENIDQDKIPVKNNRASF